VFGAEDGARDFAALFGDEFFRAPALVGGFVATEPVMRSTTCCQTPLERSICIDLAS
jgi:hypothetical protein